MLTKSVFDKARRIKDYGIGSGAALSLRFNRPKDKSICCIYFWIPKIKFIYL